MRGSARWLVPPLAVLAMAATAVADDMRLTRLKVEESSAKGDSVTAKGIVGFPRDVASPASLEFQCGDFFQTIGSGSVSQGKQTLSYRAAKGSLGIQRFTLSLNSGKFSLSVKGVGVGTLDIPVPFTLDIGGRRMTGLFPLRGAGAKRSWRIGQRIQGILQGRAFQVGRSGGNTVVTPLSSTTFVRSDYEDEDVLVVAGESFTGPDGDFLVTFEYVKQSVLGRLNLGLVLGEAGGLTTPGWASPTAGDDGVHEVVAFVQDQSGAVGTIPSGYPTILEVTGANGAPSGSLSVPAWSGLFRPDDALVSFTPYELGVLLPAPLAAGYVALAGAEVKSTSIETFETESAPTVELSPPKWVDKTALGRADIKMLQFREGAWWGVVGADQGKYDAATDRIKPDADSPAQLTWAAPVVYAVHEFDFCMLSGKGRVSPCGKLHGWVVDNSDSPIRGAVVFSRAGATVSDSRGYFEVPRSSPANSSTLEFVQVIGQGSSTARFVPAADEGLTSITVELPEAAPLDWRFGVVSGTVYEADGVTPSPGAAVTIGLSGAVQGLSHGQGALPYDFSDDTLFVPDLADLGVTDFEWAMLLPRDKAWFVSALQTGNAISPFVLLLEAQEAGRSIPEGAYTVRVRFTVPGLGDYSLFGGLKLGYDGVTLAITDIQLPIAFEATSPIQVATDAQGNYAAVYRAPLGVPMSARAAGPSGATDSQVFQFSTEVDMDFVLVGGAPPGTWLARASMPSERAKVASAELNGKVYVAGGLVGLEDTSDLEVYDPIQNAWTRKAYMPNARADLGIARIGGVLFAIGGWNQFYGPIDTCEAYNPVYNSWSSRPSITTKRHSAATAAVGGLVIVCGGWADGPSAIVETFDYPWAISWQTRQSMPAGRYGAGAGVVNGILYVIGGADGTGYLSTVVAYDPATDTWTGRTSMPTARSYFAAGVVGNEIYCAGGWNGHALSTVEIYDPATDQWRAGPEMPTARLGCAGAVVGTTFYVAGGSQDGNTPLSTLEAFISK